MNKSIDKTQEALKLARAAMKHTRSCAYQSLAQDQSECDCGVTDARVAIDEALAAVPEAHKQPAPVAKPHEQQEPVLWQILNGVCHAGVRSTENLAREAAAGMQKAHDLGGSLAAFHVRPLYTSPPTNANAGKPWVGLTDGEMRDLEKQFNAERVRTSDEEYLIIYPSDYWAWQRAIEAKLKEKNGF